jgi:mannose-6-phosphate isomerase-like protein (cupin superfamily)
VIASRGGSVPFGGDVAEETWKLFDLAREIEQRRSSGRPYREFLRVPALSAGIYSLPAGSSDLQSPHDEDEVYFVVSGSGRVRVEGEERPVGPGSIVYVGATSEHSFFEIDEDITLLVFFASGGPSGD